MRVKIKKVPKRQNGGDNNIQVTRGLPQGLEGMANVEAEKGEAFQENDGDIKKVSDNAPSHEEGGVMLDDVHKVLENTSTRRGDPDSKALALHPEDAELITGFKPKRKVSHSKALELADESNNKLVKKLEKKIQSSMNVLAKNPSNMYANNSLELNVHHLQNIPTRGELFDDLFTHQEGVKAMYGIGNAPKAKYGFYYTPRKFYKVVRKAQEGGLMDYTGAKTTAGRYTPTGVDVNLTSGYVPLDQYKSAWNNVGLDLSGVKDVSDAQGRTYDYLLDKNPDVLRAMWKQYGNTAQGLQKKILTEKYPKGVFNNPENLSIEDLKKLKGAYTDEMFGPRRLMPGSDIPTTIQDNSAPQPQQQAQPQQQVQIPPRNFNLINNPKSQFNEPLHWYDVAGPIGSYLSALNRNPVKYNPMDYHQLHLQLQNPLPALQAGQTDYNAALQTLEQTQRGQSNLATLFGKKYQIDNQILGSYENINKNITNQEVQYNTQVRDRQSGADQQARESFTQKVALADEAQRLQKLTALDDLYTRIAQNKKFNREGNLIMKLAPAFDQNADYNGYRYIFRNPLQIPQNQAPVSTKGRVRSSQQAPYNYVIIGGVKYPI